MIVDCHTQMLDAGAQFARSAFMPADTITVDSVRPLDALSPVDRAIVFGFKSRYLSTEIPNRYVAEYVRKNSPKMVGVAGIDPTEVDCLEELRIAQEELGLKGVTVSPAMQNFHPTDTRAMRLYEECVRRSMPVFFDQHHRSVDAKMEFARPFLLDEVAREQRELRIVITHLGYPWLDETIALLGKHPHIFADVAGLLKHPWLTYNALRTAYEYGVMDKLLFGSNFPYRAPAACIEALYSINQIGHGTNLVIPREQLRGIIERDALSLLGIERRSAAAPRQTTPIFGDDD